MNIAMKQISINFEATPVEAYGSLVEFVQALTHQQNRPQKAIAADMDLSPSALSRKLAQAPGDSMRFTCDNLEDWIRTNGCNLQPAYYLIQKYSEYQSDEELDQQIKSLQQEKERRRFRDK